MYDSYYDRDKDDIAQIEYVKGLYDTQVHKIKQEEYVKDLLFADYVRKIRLHKSRYDYIYDVFSDAQKQLDKKLKKERRQIETLKSFIIEDFLNNNKSFELTDIVSGGFETYTWMVEFKYFSTTFQISIPVMNNITTKNIQYAHNGMFAFIIKESEACWSVLKTSYKIEDIAKFISEYFDLNVTEE